MGLAFIARNRAARRRHEQQSAARPSTRGRYCESIDRAVTPMVEMLESRTFLTATPIAQWHFNEGSGTTAADSIGSDTATLTNATWVAAGRSGSDLSFNGTNAYLSVSSSSNLDISGAVTVAAWVKLGDTRSDEKVAGNENGTAGGYKLGIVSGKVAFEVRNSSNGYATNQSVSGGTNIADGKWHFIAGVYSQSGNFIRTYVDGSLDRSLTTTNVLAAGTGNLIIAKEPYSSSSYFKGEIDEVGVYNQAVSSSDLQTIMLSLAPPTPTSFSATPGDGSVTLAWASAVGASSYNVYRAITAGGEGGTPYASGLTSLTYTDTSVVDGTRYFYTVTAVNSAGEGVATTEIAIRPESTAGQLSYWQFNENSGSTTTDSDRTGVTADLVNTTWNATGYEGSALTFNGTNSYVSDTGPSGEMDFSGPVTVTAWVKIADTGTDRKIASNESGSGGGYKLSIVNGKASFEVRNSSNSVGTNQNLGGGTNIANNQWYFVAGVYDPAAGTVSTYVNGQLDRQLTGATTLAAGTGTLILGKEPYASAAYFKGSIDDVAVYNSALNATQLSAITSTVTGLSATISGAAQISLSWNAAPNALSYNVYRVSGTGAITGSAIATGITSTSYVDSGLNSTLSYSYAVTAVTSSGEGHLSATVVSGAPLPPTNLTARNTSQTSVQLNWTINSSDVTSGSGAAATGYNIMESVDGGSTYTQVGTASPGQSQFSLSGLSQGTNYTFQIDPTNSFGTSQTVTPLADATPRTSEAGWFKITLGTWTGGSTAYGLPTGGLTAPDGYVYANSWQDAVRTYVRGGYTVAEEGLGYSFPTHFDVDTVKALEQRWPTNVIFAGQNPLKRAIVFEDSQYSWNLDYNDDYMFVTVTRRPDDECPCNCTSGSPDDGGDSSIGDQGTLQSTADIGGDGGSVGDTTSDGSGDAGYGGTTTQAPVLIPDGDGTSVAAMFGNSNFSFANTGTGYTEALDGKDTLTHSGTQYVLSLSGGAKYTFNDFTVSSGQGSLVKEVDPGGSAYTILSTNGGGEPTQAQVTNSSGTALENWLYTYNTGVGNQYLSSETLQRKNGSGTWTTVNSVTYSYYGDGDANGSSGDRKLAVTKDAGGNTIDTRYLRYYVAGASGGAAHQVKYSLGADSYVRLYAATSGSVDAASDTTVATYADVALTYDGFGRVLTRAVQGAGCSSCSAGIGNFSYTYGATSNAPAYNNWTNKKIETQPDGNQNITYGNAFNQPILTVYLDTITGEQSGTYYVYDSNDNQILVASPSAVILPANLSTLEIYPNLLNYSAGASPYLNTTSGLITTNNYYSTTTATETTAGGVEGYAQNTSVQQGTSGTPILQSAYTYFAHSDGSGGTSFPVASSTEYTNTNGTGGRTTSYAYTWFSSSLQQQSVTTTSDTISSGQNGPGTADVSTDFFDRSAAPSGARMRGASSPSISTTKPPAH